MKATLSMRSTALLCSAVLGLAIFGIAVLTPSASGAVEYVRICSLYGAGFEYWPGTDVCVNYTNFDAREQTEGGTWRWRMPNNPPTWVPSAQGACQGGQLMKLGDFSASDLIFNSHDRYETAQTALNLKPGQYIGSVLYQGGFTGPDGGPLGNFCMFYYYIDPVRGPVYTPFGCEDSPVASSIPAVVQFTPDNPVPPQTTAQINVLGADGLNWKIPPEAQSTIQGTLSVWLCLQSAHGPNASHP